MKLSHARALRDALSAAIDQAVEAGHGDIEDADVLLIDQLLAQDDDARVALEAAVKRAEGG